MISTHKWYPATLNICNPVAALRSGNGSSMFSVNTAETSMVNPSKRLSSNKRLTRPGAEKVSVRVSCFFERWRVLSLGWEERATDIAPVRGVEEISRLLNEGRASKVFGTSHLVDLKKGFYGE